MGKQILITGTNSYVGTSFKQYIEKKKWKHAVGRPMACYICFCENSEWKKMDFSKYDTILHVAQLYIRKNSRKWRHSIMQLIQKLTEELADKAKAERVRQFVF